MAPSVYFAVTALAAFVVGTYAQAPAPGPSALTVYPLSQQLTDSPTFAYLKCDDAITKAYTAYTAGTGGFSTVPQTAFNTSLYYVVVQTLDFTKSAAGQTLLLHPIIPTPLVLSALLSTNPLVQGASAALLASAAAVFANDELFAASYPWNNAGVAPAIYTKTDIGRVVAGVGTDKGSYFSFSCGVTQVPLTTA